MKNKNIATRRSDNDTVQIRVGTKLIYKRDTMQYRQLFFYLFILFAIFPATSFALSVGYDNSGTVWYTDGISGVGTDGSLMDGMTVTVTFSDATTETMTWGITGDKSGGASGEGWSLAVTGGSTYLNTNFIDRFAPWTFTVDAGVSISQLFIDAGTGDAVFDKVKSYSADNGVTSTDGSQSGDPFAYYGMGDPGNTTATYSGLVALSGDEPIKDLYRYLSIDFGTYVSDTAVYFRADTDNIESALVVPEPSTLVLFGIGLAGLASVASRKRRS